MGSPGQHGQHLGTGQGHRSEAAPDLLDDSDLCWSWRPSRCSIFLATVLEGETPISHQLFFQGRRDGACLFHMKINALSWGFLYSLSCHLLPPELPISFLPSYPTQPLRPQ